MLGTKQTENPQSKEIPQTGRQKTTGAAITNRIIQSLSNHLNTGNSAITVDVLRRAQGIDSLCYCQFSWHGSIFAVTGFTAAYITAAKPPHYRGFVIILSTTGALFSLKWLQLRPVFGQITTNHSLANLYNPRKPCG
ncbi:hypothetical protein [Gilvimarinus xylanilyticus]|uniref:Uncharacterized protein n=1 Tax=Gilvimarinus xylanilyticus TaxID=2944139 RepID=A0A9X2I4D7_9GAMM|nr:hypothetical protein [Gilvimarinus xylanilyticus]MCP8900488.1 hypothetical protein [Gilvimarinus xylanilyticus]